MLHHRVLADYVLAGAFILFSLTIVLSVAWAEIDRRRANREQRAERERYRLPGRSW